MKFILLTISMISVSCGTELMSEPDQIIIIQEPEKPVVLTLIEDSGSYCI